MLADVSKDHSALILRVKQFIIVGVLVSESDNSKVLRKVGNDFLGGKRMAWNEWELSTWNTI